MTVNVAPIAESISPVFGIAITLADRFILTQVADLTLVFPATWVAEIVRIDRSQILDLPFYDPLLVGIANYNGRVTPLIAAAKLLELNKWSLSARSIVVRLNESVDRLGNVGFIVDRAIGNTTRSELPPELFTTNRSGSLVMMQSKLVPANLWQPRYWSIDN
jgi:hypothetical protein